MYSQNSDNSLQDEEPQSSKRPALEVQSALDVVNSDTDEMPILKNKRVKSSDMAPTKLDSCSLNKTSWGDLISSLQNENGSRVGIDMSKKKTLKLELDAIFYPKFDNEKSDHLIRSEMLKLINANEDKYYLEVTVKHSGSLILWNGTTFYSKNSTCNIFSLSAEFLLRQHFARVWGYGSDELQYLKCATYLKDQRLALAFECVTSFLGHHGDIPIQDYMILTAVANLKHETFYNSVELVSFSHQWRLPHNDIFVFSSEDSCRRLFRTYDKILHELGTTSMTLKYLEENSDVHIPSLYPHLKFQGNIMEGLVVRLVMHTSQGLTLELLQKLSANSKKLLCQSAIPSSCLGSNPVLTTDLRQLFQSVTSESEAIAVLQCILKNHTGHAEISSEQYLNPSKSDGKLFASLLSSLVSKPQSHLVLSSDRQTQRIVNLIAVLQNKNLSVEYKAFSSTVKHGTGTCVFIIHSLFDSVFSKYQKMNQNNTGMALFRGFAVRVFLLNDGEQQGSKVVDYDEITHIDQGPSLMLKLKFIPYKVRTFICRNGISTLFRDHNGLTSYKAYVDNKLRLWESTDQALEKWRPFLYSWGEYALKIKHIQNQMPAHLHPLVFPEIGAEDIVRVPFTSAYYLHHLRAFKAKFDLGEYNNNKNAKKAFGGLILIASLDKNLSSKIADALCRALGVSKLSPDEVTDKLVIPEDGLVCPFHIDTPIKLKQLTSNKENKQQQKIVLLTLSSTDTEIEAFAKAEDSLRWQATTKRFIGKLKALLKTPVMQIQMSTQDFFVQEGLENLDQIFGDKSTTSFEKLLEQLKEFSDKIPKMDCRRGMLVYFPVIPGFGKSSLCNGLTPSFVKLQSADRVLMEGDPALQINVAIPQGAQRPRKLTIRAGDAIKEKFWPTVRQEKLKEKSSIYIADKNVPPNSFYIVRDIVESLNLLGVAILPDSGALTDTTVVHRSLTTNGEDILRSYPFSLAFLVICIARVLSREHIGKLDSRSTHACMVVIKFFAFFRGLSSDSLKEQVILQLGGTTITVPFLRKNKIDMPHRLSEALETALSVQVSGLLLVRLDETFDANNVLMRISSCRWQSIPNN